MRDDVSRPHPRALRKCVQAAWRDIAVSYLHHRRHPHHRRRLCICILTFIITVLSFFIYILFLFPYHHRHYRYYHNNENNQCVNRCVHTINTLFKKNDHHHQHQYIIAARLSKNQNRNNVQSVPFWSVHTLYAGPLILGRSRIHFNFTSSMSCLHLSDTHENEEENNDDLFLSISATSLSHITSIFTSTALTPHDVHDDDGDDDDIPVFSITQPPTNIFENLNLTTCSWSALPRAVRHITTTFPVRYQTSFDVDASFMSTPSRLKPGVSIIAACKDRADTMAQALPTWQTLDLSFIDSVSSSSKTIGLKKTAEIILVDWNSRHPITIPPPLSSSSVANGNSSTIPVRLIRVVDPPSSTLSKLSFRRHRRRHRTSDIDNDNDDDDDTMTSHWILTRAYNLALRFAQYETTLKVDCDTRIARNFFNFTTTTATNTISSTSTHKPLSSANIFYAGNHTAFDLESATSLDALHANGVLQAPTKHLINCGAYDERIVTYGWDDSDIALRLRRLGLTQQAVDLNVISHISHAATRRVSSTSRNTVLPFHHPLSTATEIQRNRIMLMKILASKQWSRNSPHTSWHLHRSPKQNQNNDVFYVYAITPVPLAALDTIPKPAMLQIDARALRIVLRRYGVQGLTSSIRLSSASSSSSLSSSLLAHYRRIADTVAYPQDTVHVIVSVTGGLLARLIALRSFMPSASEHVIAPPKPFKHWRFQLVWNVSDPGSETRMCEHTAFIASPPVEFVDVQRLNTLSLSLSSKSDTMNESQPLVVDSMTRVTETLTESRGFNIRVENDDATNVIQKRTRQWRAAFGINTDDANMTFWHYSKLTCNKDFLSSPLSSSFNKLNRNVESFRPASSVIAQLHDALQQQQQHQGKHKRTVSTTVTTIWPLILDQHQHNAQQQQQQVEITRTVHAWAPNFQDAELLHKRAKFVFSIACTTSVLDKNDDNKDEQVRELKRRLNALFSGCERHACAYMTRMPDLSVISAAFLTLSDVSSRNKRGCFFSL